VIPKILKTFKGVNMHLEEIDGELHILDENLDVVHVWTRARGSDLDAPALSRPVYKHMCAWIKTHWAPDADPDDLWVRAKQAWDSLTQTEQMYIWAMSRQEEQNAQDLCAALTARLSEYRGLENVKRAFRDALNSVRDQFN
jgi:hypothetical protein